MDNEFEDRQEETVSDIIRSNQQRKKQVSFFLSLSFFSWKYCLFCLHFNSNLFFFPLVCLLFTRVMWLSVYWSWNFMLISITWLNVYSIFLLTINPVNVISVVSVESFGHEREKRKDNGERFKLFPW